MNKENMKPLKEDPKLSKKGAKIGLKKPKNQKKLREINDENIIDKVKVTVETNKTKRIVSLSNANKEHENLVQNSKSTLFVKR